MRKTIVFLLLLCLCIFLHPVSAGTGTIFEAKSGENAYEDCTQIGGQLVRGTVRISPVADQPAADASLKISEQAAAGWSKEAPQWDSITVKDGVVPAELSENGSSFSSSLTVINDPKVVLHGGELAQNETWSSDAVHVVKHWVRIPAGKTLTIAPETVVKFCPGTGIKAQGTLDVVCAHLTSIRDDSVGGDTDMNGSSAPGEKDWQIEGAGTVNLIEQRVYETESTYGRTDFREGFGGRLARGTVRISPVADQRDASAALNIGGKSAAGWTAGTPSWNSAQLEDGLHEAVLSENDQEKRNVLEVLNSPGVEIHGGVLQTDETWTADKVHVVRNWVRIPAGKTLTIDPETIVKFCSGTGIKVEGTLNNVCAYLTSIRDDSVGGDTDMNGSFVPAEGGWQIDGPGKIYMIEHRVYETESVYGRMDFREGFGGRLARGTVWISPVADQRDAAAGLNIGGKNAAGWTAVAPSWNSAQLEDGLHEAVLSENGQEKRSVLEVLNSPGVEIHGGVLQADETWTADQVHVVRNWVRIPTGRKLTIAPGSVVKFCIGTGIHTDRGGVLDILRAVLTTAGDDEVGGDTDMNSGSAAAEEVFAIDGEGTINMTDVLKKPWIEDLIWRKGSVHVIAGTFTVPAGGTLQIQPGAVVKFVSGACLKAETGGRVITDGAVFTHFADDSVGGDTDGNGAAVTPEYNAYSLEGLIPADSCVLRCIDWLKSGWNLVTLAAELPFTEENSRLLDAYSAMTGGKTCYHQVTLPLPAGVSLWLHSPKHQLSGLAYGAVDFSKTELPPLKAGWNLTGPPGISELRISGELSDRIWNWNLQRFEPVLPESDGTFHLSPGRGYWIHGLQQEPVNKTAE